MRIIFMGPNGLTVAKISMATYDMEEQFIYMSIDDMNLIRTEIRVYNIGSQLANEILNELYNLKSLPSKDSRYNNAYDDIYQHTVNNNDWNFGWVFYDSRFNLKGCEDEELLKFICRIFHPIVRNENGCWKGLLNKF